MTPLQSELQKPEYAALSDADAAARLNAPIVTGRRRVPLAEFVHRLFADATWAKLQAAANGEVAGMPAQVKAAAITVYDYLRNPHVETIDMDNDVTKSVLAALIQAGILSQPLVDGIGALANIASTRAAQLGFRSGVLAAGINWARKERK